MDPVKDLMYEVCPSFLPAQAALDDNKNNGK